jgi:exodeoxyribonuclease V alpha subunit
VTIPLETLGEQGALSALDVAFAGTVGRLADESRPAVLLAAALASRAVGLGHVCLDLARLVRVG